jgi:hypothetical protein
MTQKINSQNLAPQKNLENIDSAQKFQIDLVDKNKKILEFGPNSYSVTKNLKNQNCTITRFEISIEYDKTFSEYVDETILGKADFSNIDELFKNKKFNIIIIEQLLKNVNNHVDLILKLQNYLENDGYFIFIIPNVSFAPLRLNFLNGNFTFQSRDILNETNLHFFTLDSILLMLDNSKLKIITLHRVKQKFDLHDRSDLNYSSFSNDLIDSVIKDPESETIQFIIKAKPKILTTSNMRKYLIENFPKNIVSEQLQIKNEYLEKVIVDKEQILQKVIADKDEYLQKVIADKDEYLQKVIAEKNEYLQKEIAFKDEYLQKEIAFKDEYLEKIIAEKNEYLQKVIAEKNEYLQKVIADYKSQIDVIHSSKIWRMLKKLDNIKK